MSQNNLSPRKLVTIICCVYNEEGTLPIFIKRLQRVLAALKDRYEFELLFVNNRSADRTLEILRDFREQDPSIQIMTMSRNFGYQVSVQAGLSHASGDGMIVLDPDCEDPPEMLPQFLAKWEEGFDIVYGARKDRHENWLIKKSRNLFYHLLRASADMDIILYMAEFALISSVVRDAVINNQNTFPFLRAEMGYVGFSRFGIVYKRDPRAAGKSNYNFVSMFSFGFAGLMTSSTFLMRLAFYALPFLIAFNAAMLALSVWFSNHHFFTTLITADLLYISFMITIHGVYLARIYKNGMGRPLYVLDPKGTYLTKKAVRQEARVLQHEIA